MALFRSMSLSMKDSKLGRFLSGLGKHSPGKSIHAFVFTYPSQGHVAPTLELSYLLIANGLSVTYVTSEYFISHITNIFSEKLELVGLDDGLPAEHQRSPLDYQFHQSCYALQEPAEKLIADKIAKDSGLLHVIIASTFCPWTSTLARKFHLQWIPFWTASFSSFYMFYNLPTLIQTGYVAVKGGKARQLTEVVEVLSGILDMHVSDLPTAFIDGSIPIWLIEFFEDISKSCKGAKILLGNTFEELEYRILKSIRQLYPLVYPIGPMLPRNCFSKGNNNAFNGRAGGSNFEEDKKCFEWLSTKGPKSVLYIAFGSIATLPLDQLYILAEGIEASGRDFLWVIPNKVSLQNVLPEGFLDRCCTKPKEKQKQDEEGRGGGGDGSLNPPIRGMIISWAPQVEVLQHPSIGGFMTHCGWNSTMEAICASVPLIAWPQLAEQPTNAKFIVEEWKVGMRLQLGLDGHKLMGSSTVSDCITRLFDKKGEGSILRATMSKFSRHVQKAVLKGGSSHSHLISFIKALRKDLDPRCVSPL